METAIDFINNGNFLLNSGMFSFKAQILLDELNEYVHLVYAKTKLVLEENVHGYRFGTFT